MSNDDDSKASPRTVKKMAVRRSIAVVSGKGGSGKTMVSTLLAAVFSTAAEIGTDPNENNAVLLVDADVATAGLTYYLGVRSVKNTRAGLSQLAPRVNRNSELSLDEVRSQIQPIRPNQGIHSSSFLGIGDHRHLLTSPEDGFAQFLNDLIQLLKSATAFTYLVVDCRGGIDTETIAVCKAVDDIVLVTEPDITAYQASRHLVNVLSDQGLGGKLRGFFLNKVFQDPSYLAARGSSEFGCALLSAIPFDLEATRRFFVGDLPSIGSPFAIHVADGAARLYPEDISGHPRAWRGSEYDRIALSDPDGTRGGNAAAAMLIFLGVLITFLTEFVNIHPSSTWWLSTFAVAVIIGLGGSIYAIRRLVGRAVAAYVRLLVPRRRRTWTE